MREKGFTLIELMVVVAILGILAGVAIPMYINYMNRSRMAEVPVSIKAIKDGQISKYALAFTLPTSAVFKPQDSFSSIALAPGVWTPTQKSTWAAGEVSEWISGTNWSPDGSATFGQYTTITTDAVDGVTIWARTDIDGDGANHQYGLPVASGDPAAYVPNHPVGCTLVYGADAFRNITEGGGAF